MNIIVRNKFLIFSVATAVLSLSCRLYAATDTWDGGGGDDNWTTGNNWADNSAPANGDSIIMDGTTRLTNNNNAMTTMDWLEFAAGAGAFRITGNATTITNGLTNLSSFAQDLNMVVNLGANQTWDTTGGNLLLSGNQAQFMNGYRLIVDGGNRLILSNNMNFGIGQTYNNDRLIISNDSSLSIYTVTGEFSLGRYTGAGRTGLLDFVDGGYLREWSVGGATRIGTGGTGSRGQFIATNTPATAANVDLRSHVWIGDNRDGAGGSGSYGQLLLNMGGGNFSYVSNTAGAFEFTVGQGRNAGAYGEFLLTNFQNAAMGYQVSASAGELQVGYDGIGTGSGMATGLMTFVNGSNVSIVLNGNMRVGENFGYGLVTFDNVTNVTMRLANELRVGDGNGGAGTGEIRFLNGSMLQRLDVGLVRIGDEGPGAWGRFVATNTPNAATGFNFSNTFNVGYGQNTYGQMLLNAGGSHVYWVSNQNAGYEFNVGRGDTTEESWGQVLITNASSVGWGYHGANAVNMYVGRYGKNASTTELSTGLVRFVNVSNMNLRVNTFQVGYRRGYGEFVFDAVTNLSIRAQTLDIGATDDDNQGFSTGLVYGTNGTVLSSFAVDGATIIGRGSNSVGRLIFTNNAQTMDLRMESTIQIGGVGNAINNATGQVLFTLGGGNMYLLTNANTEFNVGRGNGGSGSSFGEYSISNIGNAVIGNQANNWNTMRVGFYGGSGVGQKSTGLVTFTTVSNLAMRLNAIQLGYRDGYGKLEFNDVTNINMRVGTMWVGDREGGSADTSRGEFLVNNASNFNLTVDNQLYIGQNAASGLFRTTNSAGSMNLGYLYAGRDQSGGTGLFQLVDNSGAWNIYITNDLSVGNAAGSYGDINFGNMGGGNLSLAVAGQNPYFSNGKLTVTNAVVNMGESASQTAWRLGHQWAGANVEWKIINSEVNFTNTGNKYFRMPEGQAGTIDVQILGGRYLWGTAGGALTDMYIGVNNAAAYGKLAMMGTNDSGINASTVYLGWGGGRGEWTLGGGTGQVSSMNIQRGTLHLSNFALNVTGGSYDFNSVTYADTALWLQNGTNRNSVTMNINGTGSNGLGVIRNIGGNSVITGAVAKTGASTIGVESGSVTIGGAFSGNFNMTKTGAGALRLNGVGTHNVGTVSGGTLELNNTNHTFNGGLTIQTGATLQGGGAVVIGNVILQNGSSFYTGTSNTIATQTFNNDLTFNNGSYGLFNFNGLTGAGNFDSNRVAGTLNLDAGTTFEFFFDAIPASDTDAFVLFEANAGNFVVPTNLIWSGAVASGWAGWVGNNFVISNAIGLQAFIWDGGGGVNANWANAANWTSSAPGSNSAISDVVFAGVAATANNPTTTNPWTMMTLSFSNLAGMGSWTLEGEQLTVYGTNGVSIRQQNAAAQTISNNILITESNQGWVASGGDLRLGGAVLVGTNDLLLSGNSNFVFIAGGDLRVNGGTVSNVAGGLIFNGGQAHLTNTILEVAAGVLTVTNGGAINLHGSSIRNANAIQLSGLGQGNAGALRVLSGTSFVTGAVNLVGNAGLGADSGATLDLTNLVTGSGVLVKVGGGTLVLRTNNTYSGGTVISNGTLAVSANGRINHSGGDLVVGGQNAILVITNGGMVTNRIAYVGFASGDNTNGVLLSGASSRWVGTSNIWVGYDGSENTVTVSNGAILETAAGLNVGRDGDSNLLEVTAGGVVRSANAAIGDQATAIDNRVLVSGSGSLWTNTGDMHVGRLGDNSSLTISNGGRVSVASNLWVGSGAGSAGNAITVQDASLIVTNAGGTANLLVGGAGSGSVTLNGTGLINADRLYMTNTGTSFNFNDGTLRTRGTVVSNGSVFTVGDGTGESSAIYIAEGGTHTFNNGLLLNTNAHFSGTGTVTGNVTNRGTMSVGGNGGANIGTVIFSNNLVLTATSTSLFSFASAGSFDSNRVAGIFGAGGNLSLTFDYSPLSGQIFTIVQGGVGSGGSFSSSNLFGTYSSFINSWTHGFVGNNYRVTIVSADAFSYWDGGDASSGNWNTTGFTNWNPDVVTPSNKVIVFGGTTRQVNTNNFASNATFISIIYTNGGFTNHGNTVRLTKGMINETGTNVFNPGINMAASQDFNVIDGLLQLNGNIAGTGFRLTKLGEGILFLEGTNSYTGGTTLDGGTTVFNGGARLSSTAGQMTIGSNNTARLVISNGAAVTNGLTRVGFNTTSVSNSILVDGPGTRWWNNSTIFFGNSSAGNEMTISGGAFVRSFLSQLGFASSASNNTILVTGAGSVYSNQLNFNIGVNSEGNSLLIRDGAEVQNSVGIIGIGTGSSNNMVEVSGAGSVWTNRASLFIGQNGAHNTLLVSNQGVVYSVGATLIANLGPSYSNSVILSGGTWSNQGALASLTLGNTSSLDLGGNRIVITNGGYLFNNGAATIGNLGSIGNTVFISGTDSRWLNNGLFTLGSESHDNVVTVTNGGLLNVLSSAVIGETASATNNRLVIGTGGSVVVTNASLNSTFDLRRGEIDFRGGSLLVDKLFWTNEAESTLAFDNGSLTMKAGMEFSNSVVQIGVSNGQTFNMTLLGGTFINQAASPRTVVLGAATGSVGVITVSGVNADLDNTENLVVGLDGVGQMILTNAGDATTLTGVVGSNSGSAGSSVLVTGNNSEWTVSSGLQVGTSAGAVSNVLTMANGGRISSFGTATIGVAAGQQQMLVSGNNSRFLAASIVFGLNGGSNTMTVTNSGEVRASGGSIIVGSNSGSLGNQVNIYGGRIVATNNPGTGAFDLRRGTVTLGSNGAIYANTFLVRSNTVFNPVLNGGTVFGNMNVEGTAQVLMGTNDFLRVTGVLSNAALINIFANTNVSGFSGIELGQGYQKLGTGQMVWDFNTTVTASYFGGLRFTNSDLSSIVDSGDIVVGGAASGMDIVVVSRDYSGTNYFTLSVGNFSTIWDGGGANNNWSTGENWVGDTSPVNDGTALIIFAANPGTRTNPFVNTAWSVQGVRFTNAMTSSYRLGGQTITVGFGGVNNNSDAAQYISNNMIYSSDSSVRGNNADMYMLGQQDFGIHKINVGGNSNTYFQGNIVGAGIIRKTNSGTLFINGVDTALSGLWTLGGTTMVNGVNVSIQNLAGTATLSNTTTFIMNGLNMDVDRLYSSNAEFNIQQGRVNAGSAVFRSFAGILNIGTSNLVSELNILGGTDNRLDADNINIGTTTNARSYLTMSNSGTQYILRANNLNVGTGAGATGVFYTAPGARFTTIDLTALNAGTNVNSYGYVRLEAATPTYNLYGDVGTLNIGGQRGTGILEIANMKFDLINTAFTFGNNTHGGLGELRIDDGAWFGGNNVGDLNLATATTNANGGVTARIYSTGGGLSNLNVSGSFNVATGVQAKGDFIFTNGVGVGNTYLGNAFLVGTGSRSTGQVLMDMGGGTFTASTNNANDIMRVGQSASSSGTLLITNASQVYIGANTNTASKFLRIGEGGIAGQSATGRVSITDADLFHLYVQEFSIGSQNYGDGIMTLDNIGAFDFNLQNFRIGTDAGGRGSLIVTNSVGGLYSLVVTNLNTNSLFEIANSTDTFGQFLTQPGFAFTNFYVNDLNVGTGIRSYGEAYFEGQNRSTLARVTGDIDIGASTKGTGIVTFANANVRVDLRAGETLEVGTSQGGYGSLLLDNATFGGGMANLYVGVGGASGDGSVRGQILGGNGSSVSNLYVTNDMQIGVGLQAFGRMILTNVNAAYAGDMTVQGSVRVGVSGDQADGALILDMGGANFTATNDGQYYFGVSGLSALGVGVLSNAGTIAFGDTNTLAGDFRAGYGQGSTGLVTFADAENLLIGVGTLNIGSGGVGAYGEMIIDGVSNVFMRTSTMRIGGDQPGGRGLVRLTNNNGTVYTLIVSNDMRVAQLADSSGRFETEAGITFDHIFINDLIVSDGLNSDGYARFEGADRSNVAEINSLHIAGTGAQFGAPRTTGYVEVINATLMAGGEYFVGSKSTDGQGTLLLDNSVLSGVISGNGFFVGLETASSNSSGTILFTNGGGFSNLVVSSEAVIGRGVNNKGYVLATGAVTGVGSIYFSNNVTIGSFQGATGVWDVNVGGSTFGWRTNNDGGTMVVGDNQGYGLFRLSNFSHAGFGFTGTVSAASMNIGTDRGTGQVELLNGSYTVNLNQLNLGVGNATQAGLGTFDARGATLLGFTNRNTAIGVGSGLTRSFGFLDLGNVNGASVAFNQNGNFVLGSGHLIVTNANLNMNWDTLARSWTIAGSARGDTGKISFVDSRVTYTNLAVLSVASGSAGGQTGLFEIIGGTNTIGDTTASGSFQVGVLVPGSALPKALGEARFINTTGGVRVNSFYIGENGSGGRGHLLYSGGTNFIDAVTLQFGTTGSRGDVLASNGAHLAINAGTFSVGTVIGGGVPATGNIQIVDGSRLTSLYVTNAAAFGHSGAGAYYNINLGDMQGSNITFNMGGGNVVTFGNGYFTVTNAVMQMNTSAGGGIVYVGGNTWNGSSGMVQIVDSRFSLTNGTGGLQIGTGGANRTGTLEFIGGTQHITQASVLMGDSSGNRGQLLFNNATNANLNIGTLTMGQGAGTAVLRLSNNSAVNLNIGLWNAGNSASGTSFVQVANGSRFSAINVTNGMTWGTAAGSYVDHDFGDLQGITYTVISNDNNSSFGNGVWIMSNGTFVADASGAANTYTFGSIAGGAFNASFVNMTNIFTNVSTFALGTTAGGTGIVNVTGGVFTNTANAINIGRDAANAYGAVILRDTTNSFITSSGSLYVGSGGSAGLMDLGNFVGGRLIITNASTLVGTVGTASSGRIVGTNGQYFFANTFDIGRNVGGTGRVSIVNGDVNFNLTQLGVGLDNAASYGEMIIDGGSNNGTLNNMYIGGLDQGSGKVVLGGYGLTTNGGLLSIGNSGGGGNSLLLVSNGFFRSTVTPSIGSATSSGELSAGQGGVVFLSAVDTYTLGTNATFSVRDGGEIRLQNNASSIVTAQNGATLRGEGLMNFSVVAQSGATINPEGNLTNTGNLTANAGANILVDENDYLLIQGNFTNAANFTIFDAGGFSQPGTNAFKGIEVVGNFTNTLAAGSNITWFFNNEVMIDYMGGMRSTNAQFSSYLGGGIASNIFLIDGAATPGYFNRYVEVTNWNGYTYLAIRGTESKLWDGGDLVNSNWSQIANWSPDAAISEGDGLTFGAVGAARRTNNNDAITTIGSITFSNSTDGGYLLQGQNASLVEGIVSVGGTNEVAFNITLSNSQFFSSESGRLVVSGDVTGTNRTLTLLRAGAAGGEVWLTGDFSGTNSLRKLGLGDAYLFGNNTYSSNTLVDGGRLFVAGGYISNNADISVGSLNSDASLIISNGADVSNRMSFVGAALGQTNHQAVVTGSGSTWTMSSNLVIGSTSAQAGLTVTDNGVVRASNLRVGEGVDAASNNVNLTAGGQLTVSNAIVGVNGGGNTILLRDSGSVMSNITQFVLGQGAGNNTLTISNGADLYAGSILVGDTASASGNRIIVTGAGSTITNSGAFVLGGSGANNELLLTNASFNQNGNMLIGSNSAGNAVNIYGSTFSNVNDLIIGGQGGGNSVNLRDGSAVMYVGSDLLVGSNSANNALFLTNGARVSIQDSLVIGNITNNLGNYLLNAGGEVFVTNATDNALLDVRYGSVTQNTGTITADRLLVTNALSRLAFNAGTINVGGNFASGGLIYSNGQDLNIGNNSGVAVFNLNQGSHILSNMVSFNIADQAGEQSFVYLTNGTTRYTLQATTMNVGTGVGANGRFETGTDAQFNQVVIGTLNLGNAQSATGFARFEGTNRNVSTAHITNLNISAVKGTGILEVANQTFLANSAGSYQVGLENQGGQARILLDNATLSGDIASQFNLGRGAQDGNGIAYGSITGTNGASISNLFINTLYIGLSQGAFGQLIVTNASAAHAGDMWVTNDLLIGEDRGQGTMLVDVAGQDYRFVTTTNGGAVRIGRAAGLGTLILSNIGSLQIGNSATTNANFEIGTEGGTGLVDFIGGVWTAQVANLNLGNGTFNSVGGAQGSLISTGSQARLIANSLAMGINSGNQTNYGEFIIGNNASVLDMGLNGQSVLLGNARFVATNATVRMGFSGDGVGTFGLASIGARTGDTALWHQVGGTLLVTNMTEINLGPVASTYSELYLTGMDRVELRNKTNGGSLQLSVGNGGSTSLVYLASQTNLIQLSTLDIARSAGNKADMVIDGGHTFLIFTNGGGDFRIGTDGGHGQVIVSNNAILHGWTNNNLYVGSGNGISTGIFQVLDSSRVGNIFISNEVRIGWSPQESHGIVDLGNMQGSNLTVRGQFLMNSGLMNVTNSVIEMAGPGGDRNFTVGGIARLGSAANPIYAEMNIVDSVTLLSNFTGNAGSFSVGNAANGSSATTGVVNFINGSIVMNNNEFNVGINGGTLANPNYGEINFVNTMATLTNMSSAWIGHNGVASYGQVVFSGGTNLFNMEAGSTMNIGTLGGRGDLIITNGALMEMAFVNLEMGLGTFGLTSNSLGNILVSADSTVSKFVISNSIRLGAHPAEGASLGVINLGDMDGGVIEIGNTGAVTNQGWNMVVGNGSFIATNANVTYGQYTNQFGDAQGNIYVGIVSPSTGLVRHVDSLVSLSNVGTMSIGWAGSGAGVGSFIIEGGTNVGKINRMEAGLGSGSRGLIVFGGQGTISNQSTALGEFSSGHGTLLLTNNGTLVIQSGLSMAGTANSTGILTIANNSRVLMSNFTAHTFERNAFVNLSNGGTITLANSNSLMQFNAGARLSGYGGNTSVTNNVNASLQMNAESTLNLQGGVTHVKGSFTAANASVINDIGSNTILSVNGVFTANESFNLLAGTNYGGFWDPGAIANFSGIELGTNAFTIASGKQITWLFDSATNGWTVTDPFYGGMRYAGATNIFQPWVDNNQITFGGLGDAYALGTTNLSGFYYLTVFNVEYIWDGGGVNGNWSSNANWVADKQLINDGKAKVIFANAASTPQQTPNVDVAWDISSLNFSNIVTSTYTIGGEQITLRALGGEGISHNSSVDQIVNNNLILSNSQSFAMSNTGDLILGGRVEVGSRNLRVQGNGAGSLIITNGGQLVLAGGGSVTNASTGGLILYGNGADGNGAIYNQFLNNTIVGGVTLGGDTRLRSESGTLIFQDAITGNQNLEKTGLGALVLNGSSNQIQTLTVQDGVFRLNGNHSTFDTFMAAGGISFITNNTTNTFTGGGLVVSNIGTLNVNGLVQGDVTVAEGGVFDVRGSLTVDGTLTAASNSTMVSLTGSDVMRVTGAFTNSTAFVINDPGNVSFSLAPKLILDSSDFSLLNGGSLTWNLLTTPVDNYFGGIGVADLNIFNTYFNNGIQVTGTGIEDFETLFFQTNGYYWLQLSQTTYIWDGGGANGNFGNTNNWVDDRNLSFTNTNAKLVFADADTTPQQAAVVNTNWNARSIEFSNVVNTAYTFSGSNLTLHAGLSGTGLVNNSVATHIFSNNVTIASNQGWYANAGSLNFAGQVNVSNRILNLDGNLGGGGFNILDGGQLLLNAGATVSNNAFAGLTINGNGGGTGAIRSQSGANTNVGGFTLGSDSTVQVDAGSLTVTGGAIDGNYDLTKTGVGVLNVNGDNNVIADLNANQGAVNINGTDNIFTAVRVTNSTVNFGVNTTNNVINPLEIINGGTLGVNNGTVINSDNLNVHNGGTLAVNGSATVNGNVNMFDGSGFTIGAGDLLDVNGTILFSNNFTFNFSDSPQFEVDGLDFGPGSTVTWNFDVSPIYGSWLMRSGNDIFSPYIGSNLLAANLSSPFAIESFYDGSYYYLQVIPEPSTYGLMGMGMLLLLVAYRRRVKKVSIET